MRSDTYTLRTEAVRENLIRFIRACPLGDTQVRISAGASERRSQAQNDRMWAMLSEVARQVQWHGQWLTAADWKEMVTAALKQQRVVPGIEGGFVVLGSRTSRMTIREMQEVIDFVEYFGAQHNVRFKDPRADTPVPMASTGETAGASVSRT